jgi:cytochrome P450
MALSAIEGGGMAVVTASDIYWDPYDVAVNADPYPVFRRLREEAPLYRNEEHDFYALSRWDDVEAALLDWDAYRSGRGTILDVIRVNVEIPPGIILFEDPPLHDLHRGLLTRVFTPKRMTAIEPMVRRYCAGLLDALIDAGGFDVIADLGVFVPMRTIGFLLGIPEEGQEAVRRDVDERLRVKEGGNHEFDPSSFGDSIQLFAEYIDWRADNPSDDLMTQLLHAEIEENDQRRRLTRTEVLAYTTMIAGAGNETAARLIGFTAQLLADHPAQRQEIVNDRSLIPAAIEEVLRFEAPSPVQCRYTSRAAEHHGQTVPKDSIMVLLNGSANRDERRFEDPDRFDIHRKGEDHMSFGYGLHFCLGAALARLEGRVALDEMLKRWPEWDVDYERAYKAHTTSVRGWGSLPIRTKRT